jgi:Na+-transporting NADH:ubiquinone oxidoreductase subunit C
VVINSNGEVVGTYENGKLNGEVRAFDVNIKTEQFNQKNGDDFVAPFFECNYEGKKYYIVPILGKGLWGPIWGNIAFKDDFNTVVGVVFDHKGETPGLGAEIATPAFQNQFPGKTIFDENGNFVSVKVQKGGIVTLPDNMQNHAVDAISGGTITSLGTDAMMRNCLSNYVTYIKNLKK